MKIENRFGPIRLDSLKNSKKDAESVASQLPADKPSTEKVDMPVSVALSNVLEGIQLSGITAGEVHSNVSSKTVERLLSESPVHAVRPRLSNEGLLALADKVAAGMLSQPEKAVAAFSQVSASRVIELT